MEDACLVKQSFWDDYWDKLDLPVEIKKTTNASLLNAILDTFEIFLPRDDTLSVLEIGGAPGQYLAYMAKEFYYNIYALDYSTIGCRKMRENFFLLNLEATIYQKDILLDDITDMPRFDIVYSLGFVEHFLTLEPVIRKHLDLLKPGGILLIGMPNLLGINRWVIKNLDPERIVRHNLASMDMRNWEIFEKKFDLEVIFRGYVGGFEPRAFRCENKTLFNKMIDSFFFKIRRVTDNILFLRNLNSKYWSGYAIGIYKKPKNSLAISCNGN